MTFALTRNTNEAGHFIAIARKDLDFHSVFNSCGKLGGRNRMVYAFAREAILPDPRL